jgi:hypothetical protein
MTTPQIKMVDAQTGEETLRDMNATELAQTCQRSSRNAKHWSKPKPKRKQRKQQPRLNWKHLA